MIPVSKSVSFIPMGRQVAEVRGFKKEKEIITEPSLEICKIMAYLLMRSLLIF